MASIARTYDCSPPAISYIVSRTRARNAAMSSQAEGVPAAASIGDSQLVKTGLSEPGDSAFLSGDSPVVASLVPAFAVSPAMAAGATVLRDVGGRRDHGSNGRDSQLVGAPAATVQHRRDGAGRLGNGSDNSAAETRATLHLSLGGQPSASASPVQVPPVQIAPLQTPPVAGIGEPHGGNGRAGAPLARVAVDRNSPGQTEESRDGGRYDNSPLGRGQAGVGQSGPGQSPAGQQASNPSRNASPDRGYSDAYRQGSDRNDPGGRGPIQYNGAAKAKEGGSIDSVLRERVNADCAAFLAAFDEALAGDSVESRAALREAADRLLRAGARTRIELERLEARSPLASPRDSFAAQGGAAAWRHR